MAPVPPVTKDAFSFAGDSFYAEASGHNRHRRATVPELHAHFAGSGEPRDPPAHWYEAQLIHYGLPPSKVKGTAKMRLFEAASKGALAVPAHIQEVETELKQEWNEAEREANKKALDEASAAAPSAKGTKRKAAEAAAGTATSINLNLSLSVGPNGAIQIQTPEPAVERAHTGQAASRGGVAAGGRVYSSGPVDGRDDPPPPYSEIAEDGHYGQQPSSSLPRRLGLLNGRYALRCPDLEDDFPQYGSDFGIIFTLDGDRLWGSFDLGSLTGVLHLPRPWGVDEGNHGFFWRGYAEDEDGVHRYYNQDTLGRGGPGNHISFLGEGEICGSIRYGPPGASSPPYRFTGFRVAGQGTRSEISPASMRAQWEDLAPRGSGTW